MMMNFMRIMRTGHAGVGESALDKTIVQDSDEINPLKGKESHQLDMPK